ncbi:hypothetical protein [Streptomyces sp. NPDC051016]|uniref:hypothetical protein n=1 Tax=Streptomyces sp. NPDC051016 TaxID=3365638 RepID=UPI0037B72731
MNADLIAFLKAHANRDLQGARTIGALRVANDARARLAAIDEHQNDPVILRALADRYGGYHVGWERGFNQPTA